MPRRRLTLVLAGIAVAWTFFCWQYIANLFVLGAVAHPGMARVGASISVAGSVGFAPFDLARSSPRVFVVVLALGILALIGIVQRAWRAVVLRFSALLLVLFCP
jgi:hypothetical protein